MPHERLVNRRTPFAFAASGLLTTAAAVIVAAGGLLAGEGRLQLSLPLDCQLGHDCFVQNYVDVDPGAGFADFTCGSASYNGHKGTDFRVLSSKAGAGISVIAAAPGRVLRRRDGVPDRLLRDYPSKKAMQAITGGRECGNGVVIDHGGGWTTQYCHLRRGSVTVKPGDNVARGAPIGTVGFSGRADFAHVHISLRHDNKLVDPFTGKHVTRAGTASHCSRGAVVPGAGTLWHPAVRNGLAYRGQSIVSAGFTGAPPDYSKLERDHAVVPATASSPALVFYGRFINLEAGDRMNFEIKGPSGFELTRTTKPLKRRKAVMVSFVGKRLRALRWPPGRYEGRVTVLSADGTTGPSSTASLVLN